MAVPPDHNIAEDPLRPHSYDGIQEYDKRLPNWWLFTLYGAIAFSVVYWLYYHLSDVGRDEHVVFAQEMEQVQAARLENAMGALDDPQLWEMSRNRQFVEAGRAVFATNCVQCHLASLRGKDELPTAIGPSLVDNVWIHGNTPGDLRRTVLQGVTDKGMPQWGPLLGDRKVVEVVAYVLSYHEAAAGAPAP
jgi:cytochrome c oxidase cbb3-type subunit 3